MFFFGKLPPRRPSAGRPAAFNASFFRHFPSHSFASSGWRWLFFRVVIAFVNFNFLFLFVSPTKGEGGCQAGLNLFATFWRKLCSAIIMSDNRLRALFFPRSRRGPWRLIIVINCCVLHQPTIWGGGLAVILLPPFLPGSFFSSSTLPCEKWARTRTRA